MAVRVTPRLIQSIHHQYTRKLSTVPSSIPILPLNFDQKPEHDEEEVVNRVRNGSVLDLDDHQKLFEPVSTTKLLKTWCNLNMVSSDRVVDLGLWIMRSKLMEIPVVREVILEIVKCTFYEQFVAGKDLEEMGRTLEVISKHGLKGMLNFGLEHAHDNDSCDMNFDAFLRTIEHTKFVPPSSVSFVIVKISAICPMSLLVRVSDQLRWEKQDPSFNLPWKKNTLPIFSESSPLYHTLKKPEPLNQQEEKDLELAHERFSKLCQRCVELNVPLTVDAEDTNIQPAIDYLTYNASIEYNKLAKEAIVFGTIQAYLKDAKERLALTMKVAEKMGIPMGYKLVRGAYMSSESKIAHSLGYDSPIHNSIDDTHNCYNDCASFMLDKIVDRSGSVVLATHNVDSGKIAARRARDLGIAKGNEHLQFAQLYGMSEALSYGLNNAGFTVSKYLTFGPVDEVMPYLLRRAEENKGVLSSSSLDRQLMGYVISYNFHSLKSLDFNNLMTLTYNNNVTVS